MTVSSVAKSFSVKMAEALEHFPFVNTLFELNTLPVEIKLTDTDPEYKDSTRYLVLFSYKDRTFKIKTITGLKKTFGRSSLHFLIYIKSRDSDSWRQIQQVNMYTLLTKVGNTQLPLMKSVRDPWRRAKLKAITPPRPKTASTFVFDEAKFKAVLERIFNLYDTNIERANAHHAKH